MFGYISLHSPHSQFQEQFHLFNGGRTVNIIRASETRMTDFLYTFHQVLRLFQSLEGTVVPPKWLVLNNKSILIKDEKDIKDAVYWKMLYDLLRSI